MKKDTLETLIREAVNLLDKHGKGSSCPEEEAMVDYVHGKLSQREKEKLERHLFSCESCLDQMMICNQFLEEEGQKEENVPASVLDRAIRLFPVKKKKSVIENGKRFLVEILGKGKEVLDTLYPVSLLPVTVRGKRGGVSSHIISFDRRFEKVIVKVEIERMAKGFSQMKVRVADLKTSRPLSRLRVTLQKEEEEVASYLTENGKVLFDRLPFGRYKIDIQDRSTVLAELSIKIRGNSHE